jgi:hypothetical protein
MRIQYRIMMIREERRTTRWQLVPALLLLGLKIVNVSANSSLDSVSDCPLATAESWGNLSSEERITSVPGTCFKALDASLIASIPYNAWAFISSDQSSNISASACSGITPRQLSAVKALEGEILARDSRPNVSGLCHWKLFDSYRLLVRLRLAITRRASMPLRFNASIPHYGSK